MFKVNLHGDFVVVTMRSASSWQKVKDKNSPTADVARLNQVTTAACNTGADSSQWLQSCTFNNWVENFAKWKTVNVLCSFFESTTHLSVSVKLNPPGTSRPRYLCSSKLCDSLIDCDLT